MLLISNSGSGRSDELQTVRESFFGSQNVRWIELDRDIDLVQTIDAATASGCRTVIAAGGDGTVNAVVNALMAIDRDRRPAMAILPLGTANDFARTLSIPTNLRAAVELVANTLPIPIDIIRIEGPKIKRYFANIAAGGNCVRVSEAMTDDIKSTWGAFSYVRGALDVLPDMMTYDVDAEVSRLDRQPSGHDQAETFSNLKSWAILVANGRTNAGGIQVAPKASVVDGWMDVILIRDGNVRDMFDIVANNLLGNFLDCDQVIFRQVKTLTLRSDPPMRFTLDGEVVDEEPVRFVLEAGAIAMHVGEDFQA